MKTKALNFALITIAIIATSASVLANNNLFLPGDAFFPTVLTKKDVEALQTTKTGERTFAYSSFGGYEGAFCGYAGYYNAKIPAVDNEFAKNLATIYARIREFDDRELIERTRDGATEFIETKGIRVLFYPPEFEFPQHRLGLRYNENWVSEAAKFGHKKEHLRLCCLVAELSGEPKRLFLWRFTACTIGKVFGEVCVILMVRQLGYRGLYAQNKLRALAPSKETEHEESLAILVGHSLAQRDRRSCRMCCTP